MSKQIQTVYYGDVLKRLQFVDGWLHMLRQIDEAEGGQGELPEGLNAQDIERTVLKRHAKFYGHESKYDGKGNFRGKAYPDVRNQYQFGQKMSFGDVFPHYKESV